MRVIDNFEVACGSVVGKDHVSIGKLLVGRNNQDAHVVRQTDDLIVAVVCDGCGSGKHSEIGAWLGANMIATALSAYRAEDYSEDGLKQILERTRRDVLAMIRIQANLLGGSFSRAINDFFLFTVVGVIITRYEATVFAIGDGTYTFYARPEYRPWCSEDLCFLGPFPDNCPPYLAYDLVDSSLDPDLLKFKKELGFPAFAVDAVVIGSDGLGDFFRVNNELVPGSKEKVGSFDQFWKDDSYFSNPEALGRKLRRMNSNVVRVDKTTGRKIIFPRLLPDDTTLVVIRRRKL